MRRRAFVCVLAGMLALPLAGNIPLVLFGVDDGTEDSIEMLNRRGENVTGGAAGGSDH